MDSSPAAFETMEAPSEFKIQQLRLELAKHLKAQEQQKERKRLASLTPAAVRLQKLRWEAKDIADKALSAVTIKLCGTEGCTRPRDVPNGNNFLKRCKRCINEGLSSELEAMTVEIIDSPATSMAPLEIGRRASKPTSKKRDYMESNIDIEEGKVEVLAKRRRKATKLDGSTTACEEIDGLAGTPGRTLPLQQVQANATAKATAAKMTKAKVQLKRKNPPKRRGRPAKKVEPEPESEHGDSDDDLSLSDAGDNEDLV